MRTTILKIHLYGGLFCAPYLVILGLSSLNYNHAFGPPGDDRLKWERYLPVQNINDASKLSERVRDDLGLVGWPLPWETRRDEAGNLQFGLARPGKHYTIHVLLDEERVEVEETRLGAWHAVNGLHALQRLPSSVFASTWGFYVEISVWVVLFSAASGIYLWASVKRERFARWVLAGCALGSLALMFYIWWRG